MFLNKYDSIFNNRRHNDSSENLNDKRYNKPSGDFNVQKLSNAFLDKHLITTDIFPPLQFFKTQYAFRHKQLPGLITTFQTIPSFNDFTQIEERSNNRLKCKSTKKLNIRFIATREEKLFHGKAFVLLTFIKNNNGDYVPIHMSEIDRNSLEVYKVENMRYI